MFHFGFTDLIYACDFTVFRDVILAQESDKEEMISKYFSYIAASEIFTIYCNPHLLLFFVAEVLISIWFFSFFNPFTTLILSHFCCPVLDFLSLLLLVLPHLVLYFSLKYWKQSPQTDLSKPKATAVKSFFKSTALVAFSGLFSCPLDLSLINCFYRKCIKFQWKIETTLAFVFFLHI